jgi:hypothetical protein
MHQVILTLVARRQSLEVRPRPIEMETSRLSETGIVSLYLP